ncbi:MAG: molecular chaperone [Candidatus Korobacteraceae bacterium]
MTINFASRVRTVMVGLISIIGATLLHASSFTVSPTRIPLSEKQRAITVRLLNTGDDPVTVQAHVVAWSLSANKDIYNDTDDVMLNPPIFNLAPGKPQLMRLGLRHLSAGESEIAYRLVVEEVPPAPRHGEIILRTVLRISIPIFVEPRGEAKKQVDWKAEAFPGGVKVTATNNGNSHVQVKQLDLLPDGSSKPLASKKSLEYLLPGQTREWTFEEEQFQTAQKLSLTAATDAGNFSVSLAPTTR